MAHPCSHSRSKGQGVPTNLAEGRKRKWRECEYVDCTKYAQAATDYCIAHGGGHRCQEAGCDKSAIGATDFCKKHGGGRRCREAGCDKSARGATDSCIAHGGGRRCQEAGCDKSAVGATDFCKKHGGGRRCREAGCIKSAQGATGFCKAHGGGGGQRCGEAGCNKYAEGAKGVYIKHGGGRRCQKGGCDKGARGASDLCKKHGGGRRCRGAGCDKSAIGATGFCKAHGGGRRCQDVGCDKAAQGATDFCIKHGGGDRCCVCSDVSVRYKGGSCYTCRSGSSLKQWETFTTKWLLGLGWSWSYSDQRLPCARETAKGTTPCITRPDYVFVFEGHVVILEVDESYHRYYAVECEVDRMGKIKDLVKLPLHLVRFNPAKGRYDLLETLLRKLFLDCEGARNAAGVLVHFVGYPEGRIRELDEEDEFCYEYTKVAC